MKPVLNPALDAEAIQNTLAREGMASIESALLPDVAEAVYHCLDREVDWQFSYRDGDESTVKTAEQWRKMDETERQTLMQEVVEQARDNYQFAYYRYPMIDAYLNNWQPRLMLNEILESINSPECLDFFRHITGDQAIRKMELQATYYAPGHFLKLHNDDASAGDDRRYACVFGFTKGWESHWGGLLQFVEDNQVVRSLTPGFNRCSLFKVPRDHQVSFVSPFARLPRYSLTGWLRAD